MVTCEERINPSLVKIEKKIIEISSKLPSKVKSQLSTIEFEKDIGRYFRDLEETFHNGLYGSLPGIIYSTAHQLHHSQKYRLISQWIGCKRFFLFYVRNS